MKLYIYLLIVFLFTVNSFSQARLGSFAEEIKNEFWEDEYGLKEGYTDDNIYYLSLRMDRVSVLYYFNYDKICQFTIIIPDDQGALNYIVENYNNQYVIVSSTEWKMYSKNGISKIQLIYDEEGGYYFMWSIQN